MNTASTSERAKRTALLPFALPDIGEEEIEAVREVLTSGWLTTGERTHELEREFANFVGAKHAVAVNSCTAALHLALESIGLQAGDEVIVPAYTFAATAEVVHYFGARPVLVDVDARSLNHDIEGVQRRLTPATKAIIPVHFAGLPVDLDSLHALAAKHGVTVIEDAAHALPAWHRGRILGALSEFTCFSFYATKGMTTGEGGIVCTDSAERAERCRIMALHGISRDAWKRYRDEGSWYYEIVAPGYKYNLTDIAAAIGLVQLRKAESMWRRRKQIAEMYDAAFGPLDALEVPYRNEHSAHSWHLYPLRLQLDRLRVTRAEFIEELKRRRIGSSVHFIPLHLHPYYRERYGFKPEDFPVSTAEYEREVSLPIYSRLTDGDVADVIDAVVSIVQANLKEV